MNRKNLLLLVLVVFSINSRMFSQGFTPPSESNAVIYFVRVSGYGGATSFEYFHNEKFISIFKNKNYIRYECPAGEHLFWASSENKEFLQCDFKVGETYMVLVNIDMGVMKSRVDLEPLTLDNKDFERAKSLVLSKKPILTTESKIQSTQRKLDGRGFVENIMIKYENIWKTNPKITQTISADMYIPKENLK